MSSTFSHLNLNEHPFACSCAPLGKEHTLISFFRPAVIAKNSFTFSYAHAPIFLNGSIIRRSMAKF
jgi:hypothetical protein